MLDTELLRGARRLRVAFSGGCDSTVLLHLLVERRDRGQLDAQLQAVHVHHGLQASADSWAEHCHQFCRKLEVPLEVLRVQVSAEGASAEDRARRARYRAWGELLEVGDLLLLAHHADDQVETVLMRLLRGAGPTGLAGMPARRPLGAGALARPLLEVPRAQLHRHAEQHRLRWVEDPDNHNPAHDRNFVRHRVLPLLRERWPAASTSIRRSAEIARQAREACDLLAADDLARHRTADGLLQIAGLAELSFARRLALVSLWCRELGLSPPPARRLSQLDNLLSAAPDRSPQLHWLDEDGRSLAIRRYRNCLYTVQPQPDPLPGAVRWDPVSTPQLSLPHGQLSVRRGPGGLNPVSLSDTEVRFRQGGELIRQAGRGCSKPLRKYLQEAGVPPWLRPGLPLIYSHGTLAAVSDLCVCEGFAAPAGTPGLSFHWRQSS